MKRFMPLLAVLLIAGCGASPATHGGRAHRSASFGTPPHGDYGLHRNAVGAVPFIPGYDAVTLRNVPVGAQAVGCYASGRYANCGEAQQRFPHAHIISIATWNGVAAKCLDVEPGDAVPSQVPGWVHAQAVRHPCVYSDTSEWAQIRVYLSHAGISRSSYLAWLADWDNIPAIPTGYDAKQWKSTATLDYDSFASAFFSTPPKPKPTVQHCLRQPYPKTASCRRVRYGYHKTLVDLRKLNRLIRAHHCTASHHPRYCAGWVYWDHRRALQIRAFVKRYA